MRLNTVASTADQNPTTFADGEICVDIIHLLWNWEIYYLPQIAQMHADYKKAAYFKNVFPSALICAICGHFILFFSFFYMAM
jgi:hypothetical protein